MKIASEVKKGHKYSAIAFLKGHVPNKMLWQP